MEFIKLLAFLCVASCCAFAYTMIEYRAACQQRKRRKRDRLVVAAIVFVFSLMATSLPLAYYTLCVF